MFKYETHLHTSPVSACASATVEDSLKTYSELGYDGIFITNHFLSGNIFHAIRDKSYAEKIEFYFTDYERALELSKKYNIKVFCGVETSAFDGTDFLIYGLDKEWFLAHEEWQEMNMKNQIKYFKEHGALVIQAHPFRESDYINHIRLFPREVDGIETINASRPDFENEMAEKYAEHYGLKCTAGSDMHRAHLRPIKLGWVECEEPLNCVQDFIKAFKEGKLKLNRAIVE